MPFSKSLTGTVSPASSASRNASYSSRVERAVPVVLALALAVARERVHPREVERRGLDDRRHRVVEVEILRAEEPADRRGRARARSAARSRSRRSPPPGSRDTSSRTSSISGRESRSPPSRASAKTSRSIASASPAGTAAARAQRITSESSASISRFSRPTALRGIVGAKRVRADELRALVGLVRGGADRGTHLVEADRVPAPRELPGALGAREAGADDRDGFGHEGGFTDCHPGPEARGPLFSRAETREGVPRYARDDSASPASAPAPARAAAASASSAAAAGRGRRGHTGRQRPGRDRPGTRRAGASKRPSASRPAARARRRRGRRAARGRPRRHPAGRARGNAPAVRLEPVVRLRGQAEGDDVGKPRVLRAGARAARARARSTRGPRPGPCGARCGARRCGSWRG